MKKKLLFLMLLCAFLLFKNAVLNAQTTEEAVICSNRSCCCGSNDPTPSDVMISHVHNKNELMVSYKYMQMKMNGVVEGTQMVDKSVVFNNYLMSPDNMRMDMHMLMAMYGLTDRLTLMAMLSYNANMMDMSMFTSMGHHHAGMTEGDTSMTHSMRTSGLGDVKLNLLYALIKQPNHQLVLSMGANLPVGNIKKQGTTDDAMYPNHNYPYSMQLGSGTFDVLPCVSYLYQKEKRAFSVQMSSVIRTSYNSVGYKLGNEATLNAWFAYQWLPFLSSSVRIEGNIADKISGKDPSFYAFNELSANTANYGGQKIQCAIGSVFQLKKGFLKKNRFGVEYTLPVYQNLNGTQMKQSCVLAVSVSRVF